MNFKNALVLFISLYLINFANADFYCISFNSPYDPMYQDEVEMEYISECFSKPWLTKNQAKELCENAFRSFFPNASESFIQENVRVEGFLTSNKCNISREMMYMDKEQVYGDGSYKVKYEDVFFDIIKTF
jgi:hypothetical protein